MENSAYSGLTWYSGQEDNKHLYFQKQISFFAFSMKLISQSSLYLCQPVNLANVALIAYYLTLQHFIKYFH